MTMVPIAGFISSENVTLIVAPVDTSRAPSSGVVKRIHGGVSSARTIVRSGVTPSMPSESWLLFPSSSVTLTL